MAKRIGPKMARVVEIVRANPGCPKYLPAKQVDPSRWSWMYGYQTVNRAIRAGLIRAVRLSNRYALYPVE